MSHFISQLCSKGTLYFVYKNNFIKFLLFFSAENKTKISEPTDTNYIDKVFTYPPGEMILDEIILDEMILDDMIVDKTILEKKDNHQFKNLREDSS